MAAMQTAPEFGGFTRLLRFRVDGNGNKFLETGNFRRAVALGVTVLKVLPRRILLYDSWHESCFTQLYAADPTGSAASLTGLLHFLRLSLTDI
jgi:hypothetical protein